ncbi:putative bacteriophage protein [Nocardia nova SH22a]|uniref:Putative bacteriophage protein n=1 Tax=Nocardia nova SH22a TaxID=1415166 RepID=W5TPK5_9NOCA|nr:hypothetical protein [Nocardia nova]AHH20848.1 putative bacteriophage protein [Nocardia nova SH22a]
MASPQSDPATAYSDTTTRTRAQLLAYAVAAWAAMPDYRDTNMAAFISALVPRVRAGQLAVANLTSVRMAQLASGPAHARQLSPAHQVSIVPAPVSGSEPTAGQPGQFMAAPGQSATPRLVHSVPRLVRPAGQVHPVLVDPTLVQGGRGVPAEQVYRRPAVEVYTALSKDVALEEAVQRGQTRLESLIATDLQMAKVRQADASLKASGKKYFRRVLKGEHNCALCIIASTQRYRVGELMPIHPGCDCEVEPLDDPHTPLILDRELLEATHQMVKEFGADSNRSAKGYRDLIVTHEHGEIGPVMAWRKQKFAGPASVH